MSTAHAATQAASRPQPARSWWEYLQWARSELEVQGATFRPGLEISSEVEQVRGEHDRVEAICWESDWMKHHPG